MRSFGTKNNAKVFQSIEKEELKKASQACTILSVNVWIRKNALSIELATFTNVLKTKITRRLVA